MRSGKDALPILLVLAAATAALALLPGGVSPASAQTSSITLGWTAPGDDGKTGSAARYDLRYSTSPLTEATFASATAVAGMPVPQPAGTRQSVRVPNLLDTGVYYFAMKTVDAAGNWSGLSNVAVYTGPNANPGQPRDPALPLSFGAPRPNPAKDFTRLVLDLPQPSRVWIEVLDVLGRRVRLVADEFRPSGHHEFAWYLDDANARPLPAGVYLVRARALGAVFLRRMAIVR